MDNVLQTNRLILQPLDESHVHLLLDFCIRNKDFLLPWSPSYPSNFFTQAYQQEAIKNEVLSLKKGQQYKFYIFSQQDHERKYVLGSVSLSNIIRGPLQSCFLGYKIDEKMINKGIATEAIAHVVRFAFDRLTLHRIEANIMPRNKASIRVAEKLGFEKEGFSKNYLQINGVWEDHFRFALVNSTNKK